MKKVPRVLVQELAIGCLTAITITALLCGINHSLVAGATATIAGIAGYSVHKGNSTK